MIKIGIVGFGNISKKIIDNCNLYADMKIVAIFSRHAGGQIYNDIEIYPFEKIDNFKNKIDVMMICVGSKNDVTSVVKSIATKYNTVDCFDDHQSMRRYIKELNKLSVANEKTSIIGVGWDPGVFSMARCLYDAILPGGKMQTFWGKGISQGHSEAIRNIEGVIDARQYTIPNKKAIKNFEKKNQLSPDKRFNHKRLCYVVVNKGCDKINVENKIKNMPHYFKGYDTTVKFISKKQLLKNHNNYFHSGFVEKISIFNSNFHNLKFGLKTDSNPEITACIMLSFARACYRLNKEQKFGGLTVLDVPIKYLVSRGGDLIKYI